MFGHKPTWGVIPPYGHSLVPGVAAMTDISVVGPLARSADDLLTAFDVLAGPDPSETTLRFAFPAPRSKTIKGLRVAVWAQEAATHTDAETTAMLLALARSLKRDGAKVSLTARPAFDPRDAFNIYLKLLVAALSGRSSTEELDAAAERARGYDADDLSAPAVMARAARVSHPEWLGLNERRHRIRRAWGAFFQDWDVLLCPVLAVPAQTRMEATPTHAMKATVNGVAVPWNEMLFWPGIVGGFHLPATSAPLGLTAEGLPVGVQIVGPLYGDRTTIAVARMLETGWRGFEPPPGYD